MWSFLNPQSVQATESNKHNLSAMSSLIKIYPKRDSKVILVYVAEEVPLYKSRLLIQVQGEVLPCMCVSHACSIILGGTTRNAKLALSRLEDLNFQRQLLTELWELLWRFLRLVKKKSPGVCPGLLWWFWRNRLEWFFHDGMLSELSQERPHMLGDPPWKHHLPVQLYQSGFPRKEERWSASPLLTQALPPRDGPYRKAIQGAGRWQWKKEGRGRTARKSKRFSKAQAAVSPRVGLDFQGQQTISAWEDSWQRSEANAEHSFAFSQTSSHHLAVNPHHHSVSVFEMDINLLIHLLSLERNNNKMFPRLAYINC